MQPVLLTVKDVAERYRISPTTVRNLLKRGKLPGFKIAGHYSDWRVNIEHLEEWQRRAEAKERKK